MVYGYMVKKDRNQGPLQFVGPINSIVDKISTSYSKPEDDAHGLCYFAPSDKYTLIVERK